jgi:alpha-1,3-rhamnosyl/mannosyltransferase
MKIGINAVCLLSPLTGIGQYTRSLVAELQARDDLQVELFYGSAWSSALRTAPLPGIDSWKRAFKRWVPRAYAVNRALQQVAFTQGARKRTLDLYHEPSFLAYRFAGPTVVSVHDLSWIRFPATQPADRVAALNAVLPSALARAAHVITDAEYVRREVIATFGLDPGRVSAVPLAARAAFRPRPEDECPALAAYGLRYRQFVLCVGTLEPRKNLATALRAYGSLPSGLRERFPLAIAGMRGWLAGSLERTLDTLVATGQVRLLGYVSDEALAQLYAGAKLLAYPSLYEGFGLPPLEAMASATPVIVSSASTLPEVVGDSGRIVDPCDVDALSEDLRLLLEDEGAWARYRNAGIERSRQFSWRRCAEQTVQIYRGGLRRAS